jgi:trans-L-3-hydroxyproline dehydratase
MCGHGIIGVAKVAILEGLVEPQHPVTTVRIDTPAGRVTAFANVNGSEVGSIYFDNVPSFVDELGGAVEVPRLGIVHFDVAFGGAFYAYVDADELGIALSPESAAVLIDTGMAIKQAVARSRQIRHPNEADLGFLYGTIFVGRPHNPQHHSRNVCIFADGEVDRSPTGTGVSGRLAIHHARGELSVREQIMIESLIGSTFACEIRDTTAVGGLPAVLPRVEGRAFLTGRHEFVIDPKDPFREGFIIR